MDNDSPNVMRTCPQCGETTSLAVCPQDASATVQLRSQPLPWTTGAIIDHRYRLETLLGRGGYGAVFAALDLENGELRALKMLSPTDRLDDVRRFHREADILARLRSPHTVRVLGRGPTADGSLYLAMELLRGISLNQWLRDRTDAGSALTEAEATVVGIQVLLSLEEAHAQGLVHRDLKPSNVMVSQEATGTVVRVVDFGIAHVRDMSVGDDDPATMLDRVTATGKVMGTPSFMSPEQCMGSALDGRSDLYSLGVLLYRCVAGELPFDDPNPLTLMYNHVHAPPRDLLTVARTPVSVAFSEIVLRALAKSPADRFADARAMRLALESGSGARLARRAESTTADYAEYVEAPSAPPKRGTTRHWAMAATALILAATGAFAARRTPEPDAKMPPRQVAAVPAPLQVPTPPPAVLAPPPAPQVATLEAPPLPVEAPVVASAVPPGHSGAHVTRSRFHPRPQRRDAATVLPPD